VSKNGLIEEHRLCEQRK